MATLLWQLQPRDIASDAAGVKNTFSSWDSCMSKAYCKWPAIVGIIIGSLVALSLIWCLARCLCCGAECCCGCLSCCNACCPSPRGRKNAGYQHPPPQPYQSPYPQPYQSPQPPMYASGAAGYRGPQTATFDAPTRGGGAGKYNEDALPAMPSWDTAESRRVEEEVEMEKLSHAEHTQAQQQRLLPQQSFASSTYSPQQPQYNDPYASQDVGSMHASPYHNYNEHTQYAPSVLSQQSTAYAGHDRVMSPVSAYEGSVYPPSYHTQAPGQQVGRKPVGGSWRDV
ncbi:hypothetical protein LTR95_011380 [Oleoguttula sp. CCFEE 5521]